MNWRALPRCVTWCGIFTTTIRASLAITRENIRKRPVCPRVSEQRYGLRATLGGGCGGLLGEERKDWEKTREREDVRSCDAHGTSELWVQRAPRRAGASDVARTTRKICSTVAGWTEPWSGR